MPRKYELPEGFTWNDEPTAVYPAIPVPESLSRSSYCRGCGGDGDGICEYHANMWRRAGQRWIAVNGKKENNER